MLDRFSMILIVYDAIKIMQYLSSSFGISHVLACHKGATSACKEVNVAYECIPHPSMLETSPKCSLLIQIRCFM